MSAPIPASGPHPLLLRSTFSRYAEEGRTDYSDPRHRAEAADRYARARYGLSVTSATHLRRPSS